MAEWPGIPAGFKLPLVNDSTERLPEPTMDAIEQALIPTIETEIETQTPAVVGAEAANSTSAMRVALAGAFASTSLFDRKRTPRPPLTIVAPLVAGHSWTGGSTGTNNLNDTSDWAIGDRCISATAVSGAGASVKFQVTGQDFDLTGRGLVIWLKVTNRQRLTQFYLDVGDNTFANRYRLNLTLPSGGKSTLWEGEWSPLFIPFSVLSASLSGASTVTGSPTRSGLTALRIFFGDTGGAGDPVTVKFGGVAKYTEGITRYPNGVASFTCDDTWKEHIKAAEYVARKGGTVSLFPIIGRIDTTGSYYTLAELRKAVSAYGAELGFHAMNDAGHVDVTGRPQATVEAEFRAGRQWAFDNGFPPMVSYAYPIGPFDKNGVESVRRYFGYGRTNDQRLMTPNSDHRYSASALVLGSSITLAQAKAAVDAAEADGLWVNFVVHDLPTSSPTSNGWLWSDFTQLVDYIAAAGMPCAAAGDVVNAL